jgi:ADP-glucose pyrophosphorylase
VGSGPGIDAFFKARPRLPEGVGQNVPFLRHAAWDTATSTGALRLIDYDLAAALSEIYALQQYSSATFASLFAQSAFYDGAARSATIRLSKTAMTEMVWTEGNLAKLYGQHLPAIRAAASGR